MKKTDINAEKKTPGNVRRLIWRIGLVCVGLVVLLPIFGVLYQTFATIYDSYRFPPPGKLIDVGGYRLHLNETGAGSPTVVFEAGMGDCSLHWQFVQAEVEKVTRVCSYDRGGLGWSDPSPTTRTVKTMARELHILLNKAGVPGPYVLVGHSFGGFTVRAFAQQYPDEVAGMVLVDSINVDQLDRMRKSARPGYQSFIDHLNLIKKCAPFGITRLFLIDPDLRIPKNLHAIDIAIRSRTSYIKERYEEEILLRQSAAEIKSGGPIPQIPLTVLTQDPPNTPEFEDYHKNWEAGWIEMQNEFAKLSTNSIHITVPNSSHLIHIDQPAAVSKAILEMISAIREKRPIKDVAMH